MSEECMRAQHPFFDRASINPAARCWGGANFSMSRSMPGGPMESMLAGMPRIQSTLYIIFLLFSFFLLAIYIVLVHRGTWYSSLNHKRTDVQNFASRVLAACRAVFTYSLLPSQVCCRVFALINKHVEFKNAMLVGSYALPKTEENSSAEPTV
jgi:hypothetical protein